MASTCPSVHQQLTHPAAALQAALQLQHSTAVTASTATMVELRKEEFSSRKQH
jgi:hypothetical protein